MKDHTPIIEPIDLSNLRFYTSLQEIAKDYDKEEMGWREHIKVSIESSVATNLEEIKSKMKEDDVLIYWISPEWTWDCLAGRAGYAIKRSDEYIDPICVMMS